MCKYYILVKITYKWISKAAKIGSVQAGFFSKINKRVGPNKSMQAGKIPKKQ